MPNSTKTDAKNVATNQTGSGAQTDAQVSEPEPALKVAVIRNPAPNAPLINSMSVSRGDAYEQIVFDEKNDRFELSVEDARQVILPQRVEIPTSEGMPPRIDYIAGFVVAPDSPVKLKQ